MRYIQLFLLFVTVFFPVTIRAQSGGVDVGATVPAICGNSAVEDAEQCDDGNTTSGDGCSATCTTEGGGVGVLPPSPGGDTGDAGDGDGGDTDTPPDGDSTPPDDGDTDVTPDTPDEDTGDDTDTAPPEDNGDGGDTDTPPEVGEGDGGEGGDDVAPPDVSVGIPGDVSAPSGGSGVQELFTLDDVSVWLYGNAVATDVRDGAFETVVGVPLTIGVHKNGLPSGVDRVFLSTGESFAYSEQTGWYVFDLATAQVGEQTLVIHTEDTIGEMQTVSLRVSSLGYGRVYDSATKESLSEVEVQLYDVGAGDVLWGAAQYSQRNPIMVQNGRYVFLVPNGTYRLEASVDGYRQRRSFSFVVQNHIVNADIALVQIPPALRDVIDPDAPLTTNAINVAKNILQKTEAGGAIVRERAQDVVRKVQEVADNPQVEEVNKRVVAPSAVTISAAAVVPSLWSILFPLLRYLFLQPLLLLGRRNRRAWGQVYNTLTKLPVDLATVRLLDAKTKRVILSRVTDANGRYVFIVEPGTYVIDVIKQGFRFPSSLLADVHSDGRMADIYHAEEITVEDEGAVVTPNIPLDPEDAPTKTPARIIWEKRLRAIQHVTAFAGIGITVVSLYISPTWYIGVFLLVHVLLYALFLRHVKPKRPKGWGIVYEQESKKPISRTMARLFTKQYNKLVASEVTDKKGRYSFLVGPNEYYLVLDKPGYARTKVEDIHVEDEVGVVRKDVALKSQKK